MFSIMLKTAKEYFVFVFFPEKLEQIYDISIHLNRERRFGISTFCVMSMVTELIKPVS